MTGRDLSCRELVELVTDYLEGALPAGDAERFEAHLPECPYCVVYLEQMRAVIRAGGTLREDTVSEAAVRDLLRAFGEWKGR